MMSAERETADKCSRPCSVSDASILLGLCCGSCHMFSTHQGCSFLLCSSLTASDSTPLSLSRCTDVPKDSSVFFATRQSCGRANDCPLLPSSRQLMLQLHLKGKNCMPSAGDTDSIKQKLQKKLVSEINQRCGCGLSMRQIKSEHCRLCVFFKVFATGMYNTGVFLQLCLGFVCRARLVVWLGVSGRVPMQVGRHTHMHAHTHKHTRTHIHTQPVSQSHYSHFPHPFFFFFFFFAFVFLFVKYLISIPLSIQVTMAR